MADKKTANTGYYDELVPVRLFKDDGKYKDDVFVAVNGVGMIVPRGKDVKIPRKFAIVLENSGMQDEYAADFSAKQRKKSEAPELN